MTNSETQPHINELLSKLDFSSKIGQIEVHGRNTYNFGEFINGTYDLGIEDGSNTGILIGVGAPGNGYLIKTGLKPDHPFLYYEEKAARLWTLAAEYEKASQGQEGWSHEEKIHLGLAGIRRTNGKFEKVPISSVTEDDVEPGLVMRWLPKEDNFYEILKTDPKALINLIPSAIETNKRSAVPLSQKDAFVFTGANGVYNWINDGNLNVLREWGKTDKRIKKFVDAFWLEFSRFTKVNSQMLDTRSQIPQQAVWFMGDTKLLNTFRVGEKAAILDPITLLLKTKQKPGYVLAPWAFKDRIGSLAYLTVYLRAFELDQSLGVNGSLVRQAQEVAIKEFFEQYGEDVRLGNRRAIFKLHEAAYASVETQVMFGLHKENGDQLTHDVAWALAETALDSINEAHQIMGS
jgi:hypothetical protein